MALYVAPMNAHAVCPEGNERESDPSGRSEFTACLVRYTLPAIMAVPKACDVAMRAQELRVGAPKAFIAHGNANGMY